MNAAVLLFFSLLATGIALPVRAVIFISTGDPTQNTTDPGDGSGWQWQGQWGSFLGTAIGPDYFVTAKHVGGSVGQTFTYQGTSYTTTASFSDPNADLTIWQVNGTFSSYAQLYTGSDEAGQQLTVFGRGTQRGDAVTVNGNLAGWLWGPGDGVQRWGQNRVSGIQDYGGSLGQMLVMNFDAGSGLPYEATLSPGDSGGGVFIQQNGVWKLAGLNYGVVTGFQFTATSDPFNAAIFNANGLYYNFGGSTGVQLITSDGSAPWVATRISADAAWINGITGVPEPASFTTIFGGGLGLLALLRMANRRRAQFTV
jgi:hypothetical protein